jgi:hypothetical protein
LRRHCCTCSITARQTFYVRRSIRTKPPYGNMIGADPPALRIPRLFCMGNEEKYINFEKFP